MRARSKLLSGTPAVRPVRAKDKASGKAPVVARMAPAERKAMILARAIDFFAEYGLTAQTRALAAACGVAQRLLYRYFPSKAALLDEVYHEAIVSPFKAVWLVQLKDRTRPIETRLVDFYRAYYSTVLTRKWLRLFLYASLAEAKMAPDYNDAIVHELLETIVAETARALKVGAARRSGAAARDGLCVARSGLAFRHPASHLRSEPASSRRARGGPACAAVRNRICRDGGGGAGSRGRRREIASTGGAMIFCDFP